MDKQQAKVLAEQLMKRYYLYTWTFEFNNNKSSLGICRHGLKVIGLSNYFLPSMDVNIVKNTLLHEIAHALVGSGHGHGHVWRRKALEIGCDGERTSRIEIVHNQISKYVAECSDCGHIYNKHRRPKRQSSCSCLGYFNPSKVLTFVQQY